MEVLVAVNDNNLNVDQAFLQRGFKLTKDKPVHISRILQERSFEFIVTDQPVSALFNLRNIANDAAIISLRQRWSLAEKMEALDCGADECLVAPVLDAFANARINSLVRRIAIQKNMNRYRGIVINDDWSFDMRKRALHGRDGTEHRLRKAEARLLLVLLDYRGKIVSRQHLVRVIWYRLTPPQERYVDHLLAKLRRCFQHDNLQAPQIMTVHGKGYLLR